MIAWMRCPASRSISRSRCTLIASGFIRASGRATASNRSLARMRLPRMRTAAMVMMSSRFTSSPVVSQSNATTSSGGPGRNMKRYDPSPMVTWCSSRLIARGSTSERAEVEVPPHDLAELLHHLERIAQQVALQAGEVRRPHQRARGTGGGQLSVQPQRHQEVQRLRQLPPEVVAEGAGFDQALDTVCGAGLCQGALQRQAA